MAFWWRERRSELLRFGVVGGVAFVVDLGLFNLLVYGSHPVLEDRIVTAKIVSAAVATIVSWVGNRMWTFRARRTNRPIDELIVFALINVVALLIPVVTVAFTAYVLGARDAVPANIAAIVGIGIGTITRYIGYRRYVFADAALLRARLFGALCASPDRILLVTVALAVACAATVSLGVFRPWTALPLAAGLSAACWRIFPSRAPDHATARGSGWLLGGVFFWLMVNFPFVAQFLIVRRDPGFLTLTGLWLIDHPSADIPTGGAIEAASLYDLARADQGEAWTLNGDVIQAQGAKLLPSLLAVGGWAGGTTGVMVANLVIGGIGLVAVYVLARQAMGPIAALVPTLGVALTISHMWLSRAPYAEPLTMLLLVTAIAWGWRGVKESRAGPILAAAVASGLIMFARIDGAAYAIGLLMGVALAVLGLHRWSLTRRATVIAGFALIQGLVVALGNASLMRWSRAYVHRLDDEVGSLGLVYALAVTGVLIVALGALVVGLRSRRTDKPASPLGSHRSSARILPWVAASLVVAAFVGLASRPLWTTVHGSSRVPDYIEYLQKAAGVPVDATRTYAESTVTWMSMYLTWPLLILGVGGLALAAWKWGRGDRGWVIPLAAFLAPCFLYLVKPSIVPDQVWAIRRLYPSGVTGLVVAASFAWLAIVAYVKTRSNAHTTHLTKRGLAAVVALAPLLTWLQWTPSVVSSPVIPTSALYLPEQMGARAQIETLCSYVDGRPVILLGTSSHFGTIRVSCDVPVVLVPGAIDAPHLDEMASVFEEAPVVLTERPERAPWVTTPSAPTFEARALYATGSLLTLPIRVSSQSFHWYVGDVLPNGTVEFVSAPRES